MKPRLSIILASQNAAGSVEQCLSEIENQRFDKHAVEVVVVDNSTDHTAELITTKFPEIKLLTAPKEKLIPELWKIGIENSTGDLIALTTTHFIPAQNWISEIVNAHQSPAVAGIGGTIENDVRASIISWAVYFCRYSNYMLPFVEKSVEDFAADNASYKRASLNEVKDFMRYGFWEVFVHQALKKKNMQLVLTPEIIVYHQESFTFLEFLKQRFFHGKQFSSTRTGNISNGKRITLVFLSPLIMPLYIYRITKRVFIKNRNLEKYFLSLPILFLFLASWSFGEFCGYLTGFEKRSGHLK